MKLDLNQFETKLLRFLGFSGGDTVLAKNSTEKTVWNHGGKCEKSSKGILGFCFSFLVKKIKLKLICHSYDALKKGRKFDKEIDAVQKFT